MTIRKQWIIMLLIISFITVILNSLFLAGLTKNFYSGHMNDRYEAHKDEIIGYLTKTLENYEENKYSPTQMKLELMNHLDEPITGIRFVDYKNRVDISVGFVEHMNTHMGHRHMKNWGEMTEKNKFLLFNKDEEIGYLEIEKFISVRNTSESGKFSRALMKNTFISSFAVIIFSIIIGITISRKTSKELSETAKYAQSLDYKRTIEIKDSKVIEINNIRRSLNELKTKLQFKEKSRKNLIDELVHQTRTPLTIIKTHLEAVEDEVIDLGEDEIDILKNEVENLTTIISNITKMIEVSGESKEIVFKDFDLSQAVNRVCMGLKNQFKKKNISFRVKVKEKIVINSDEYRISQSVYNILTNAYKFTDNNGHVDISLSREDGKAVISIKDDGIGMDKKEKNTVFEAYVSTRKKDNQGEGLGLYIVKKNIEDIGGKVEVISEIDKGSEFRIIL
ncbi:MAG: HAMP domain-containing histidine kinase [Firmicutes bacterium]|jgi:signal transduction histidine kinase|nr:HAMP domain-containing histidine kinase [Bacillota bacterium]